MTKRSRDNLLDKISDELPLNENRQDTCDNARLFLVLAQGRSSGKAWIVRDGRYETTDFCA